MNTWPSIAIGVITYNRPKEIRTTIRALVQHLAPYPGKITFIIADDSTGGDYLQRIEEWFSIAGFAPHYGIKTITTERNSGWGANANNLLSHVFDQLRADYLFFIEDDYVLTRPLDLVPAVALMEREKGLGMLRFRATAGIPVLYAQHETDISARLPEYREYEGYTAGRITWLELLPKSPTLWIYSNGPHLKRREFHDQYGRYPVGLKLGATEEHFAHTVQDQARINSMPLIGVLPEWIYMHWQHIGVSYQHTAADK